jgi:hypothetical protein
MLTAVSLGRSIRRRLQRSSRQRATGNCLRSDRQAHHDAAKNAERDLFQLRNVGLAGLGFEANTQSKGRPQLLEHRGVAQPHTHGHAAHLGPLALVNFVHPSA